MDYKKMWQELRDFIEKIESKNERIWKIHADRNCGGKFGACQMILKEMDIMEEKMQSIEKEAPGE